LKLGAKWKIEKIEGSYHGEDYKIPEDIREVGDDICNKVLKCRTTGRHYKIIPQELKFYRKMKLPIPLNCPDERHYQRLSLHNPFKLWVRKCDKCGKKIQSSYSSDRAKIVYCEKCYLQDVY